MNCTTFEQVVFVGFAISLLLASFASWRMQKLANIDDFEGPKWKLLLGDIILPKSTLSGSGLQWRKVSLLSFSFLVLFGIAIGVLNINGSTCFGLNS